MNKNPDGQSLVVTVQPKLSVTLNGGSDVLESARIPVQFGVNAPLAEIQPTHILVVIQHLSEKGRSDHGIRKVIPLSRGSDFICFESAGEHTVTFMALKSTGSLTDLEENLEKSLQEYGPG